MPPAGPTLALVGDPDSVHIRRWALALHGAGYRVTILSSGGLEAVGPVPVEPIFQQARAGLGPMRALRTASEYARVRARLRQFDLVHVHYLVEARANSVLMGLPRLLITPYGSDVLPRPASPTPPEERTWTRRAFGAAQVICPSSAYMASRLQELYAIPEDKLHVVYMGVDTELFTPAAHAPPSEPFTIGFFKHLQPIYGPQVLLEAAALVRERSTGGLRVLMYGVGPMEAELREIVKDRRLEEVVEFRGWVDHESLPQHMRQCHVVVSPSVVDESLGVASLEAQALGIPVINSDVGGMPETVRDRETGFLVAPGDVEGLAEALIWLETHSKERTAMGRAGAAFVREAGLDWKTAVETVDRLQRGLLR